MLNKCVERGMVREFVYTIVLLLHTRHSQSKCFPYWPHAEDPPLEAGVYRIENLGTDEEASYQLSNLKLLNTEVSMC